MIYVILGETNSGKSTIFRHLEENKDCKKIISVTTRPERQDEVDGVDYFFLENNHFDILKSHDRIISPRSFINASGDVWNYGILRRDIESNYEKKIVVTDPQGLEDLISELGKEEVISIYIDCKGATLFRRGLERGDDPKEIERRINADYDSFHEARKKVDFIVDNSDGELGSSIEEVEQILNF